MKKILIVEDERICALALKMSLTRHGFEVLPPVDSAELCISSALEHKPDVILLDILLKGPRTGIDAALHLNEIMRVPFIFMTGNEELVEREKLKDSLHFYVHSKPINERELIRTLNNIPPDLHIERNSPGI